MLACTKQDQSSSDRSAMRVKTMTVQPQDNNAVARYVGTVLPAREIPLSVQTTGRIVAVHVSNGERVQQGQCLLRVDSTQAKNAVVSAEAALHRAQDAYNRLKQVHSKGVVADQKMVEIESQLAQAKSLYEAAKQQLSECVLTAPCAGVISGLEVEKGQTVIPDRTLCMLLELSELRVLFTVPEAEIGAICAGSQGQVECTALDTVLPVTVTRKNVTANTLTHTYDVTASIHGGSDVLLPGMVGKVTISKPAAANSEPSDIIIPAACILLKPEGPTVWVVEDGKVVRRQIATDGYQADGVRVLNGLEPGDIIVTEGYQKLYNGCKVICD